MNFLDDRLPKKFWDKCIPEPNSRAYKQRKATAEMESVK